MSGLFLMVFAIYLELGHFRLLRPARLAADRDWLTYFRCDGWVVPSLTLTFQPAGAEWSQASPLSGANSLWSQRFGNDCFAHDMFATWRG